MAKLKPNNIANINITNNYYTSEKFSKDCLLNGKKYSLISQWDK